MRCPPSFGPYAGSLRSFLAGILTAALVGGSPAHAEARSLVERLHHFFLTTGFPAPNFIEVVTPVVERLALRGIDFPVTSSAPGFTYRFNFELGALERSTESFGPVFVDIPGTVGRHRLDLGATYLGADITEFGGTGFGRQIAMTTGRYDKAGVGVKQEFVGTRFSLTNHEILLSATYGLTDAWDVNLLQPLFWNSLELDGVYTEGFCPQLPCSKNLRSESMPVHFKGSAFGPGDTLLRTKYRVLDTRLASVATALTLRLPVGGSGNLHGLGDTTVTPSLLASHALGAHELHGSLGFEFNADDGERDRVRYALGGSLRPFKRLAFLLDIIGSSSLTADEFEIVRRANGPSFAQWQFGADEFVKSQTDTKIVAFVPRSDVVDLVLGVKVNPWGSIVGFTSVILPLTSDGLRAEVIPSVGLELSF